MSRYTCKPPSSTPEELICAPLAEKVMPGIWKAQSVGGKSTPSGLHIIFEARGEIEVHQ